MSLTVNKVAKNSPAKKAGIKKNDIVHKIDKIDMHDFIDDTYANTLTNPTVILIRNGKEKKVVLKKRVDQDIGLEYSENLYPDEKQCVNACVFCFVDQLPKGMRKSLYVKDDDWRYSVLYGNYITMTNMADDDFERIATRNVSPLYISVHATDPDVRMKMMRNKKAVLINEQLKFLYDHKITFHSQIVLCPGINDEEILNRTIEDIAKFYPYAKTLSVVPVGLTAHREGLPELKHVGKEKAAQVIETVKCYRKKYSKEFGSPFVYASDEFYSKAQMEYPRYEPGEINAQKANGAGLFSDFLGEFEYAVKELDCNTASNKNKIIVTGSSAYSEIKNAAERLKKKCGIVIEVVKVVNRYFGESITVAGLLTGCDIIEAVGKRKADVVFVPENSLRDGANIFLDDMTIDDVEKALGTKVAVSPNDGYEFVMVLIGDVF